MTSNPHSAARHQQGLRIAVIGACYYMPPSRFSKVVAAFVRNLLPPHSSVQKCYVGMRSTESAPAVGNEESALWIGSSGHFLDISAYASAAAVVGNHDLYLVLNDTLFAKHPWHLISKSLGALIPSLAAISEPAAAGVVHPTTDLLLVDTRNPTRRHLSTFCFLLNPAGFAVFRELADTLPTDGSNEGIRDWLRAHGEAHVPLKHLLHVHLTGPVSPWSWKGRLGAGVSEELVLRKAVTVAFEYLFSEQMLRLGGLVMPINLGLTYRMRAKAAALYSRIGRR